MCVLATISAQSATNLEERDVDLRDACAFNAICLTVFGVIPFFTGINICIYGISNCLFINKVGDMI